jgi:hypothetical protein
VQEATLAMATLPNEEPTPPACRCAAGTSDLRIYTEQLNLHCACLSLDREALHHALRAGTGDAAFVDELIATRPHLASNVSVFVSREDAAEMMGVVRAVEATAALPAYRAEALDSAESQADFGTAGIFMGYDFHITPDGPRLIEINTNAGGAFVAALLGRAQRACCAEVGEALAPTTDHDFDAAVVGMFEEEWRRQRGGGRPAYVAIVDDAPEAQYLYPEFVLAKRLLEAHGIAALIADPRDLVFGDGRLSAAGETIDFVYNRLTDFALEKPGHAALRGAYLAGAAVVSPGPRHHALLADKRNLVRLSNSTRLAAWGLAAEHLSALQAVPRALVVDPQNADALWAERKRYFFKPYAGHASKAVYRGDKLTKRVWAEIAEGCYIAQEIAAPGERMIGADDERRAMKMDVRLYTYDGRLLLAAARLYQGQTTNFRTPGGGFAPVFLS